jgi:hypothetical protein
MKKDAFDTDHDTVSPSDDAPNANGGIDPYSVKPTKVESVKEDVETDENKMKEMFMKQMAAAKASAINKG